MCNDCFDGIFVLYNISFSVFKLFLICLTYYLPVIQQTADSLTKISLMVKLQRQSKFDSFFLPGSNWIYRYVNLI